MNQLAQYTTAQLVEELKLREGVETHYAAPHVPYSVDTADSNVDEDGPATILVIID